MSQIGAVESVYLVAAWQEGFTVVSGLGEESAGLGEWPPMWSALMSDPGRTGLLRGFPACVS
jgi:hypothetical protein